ncbi:hypothetical protein Q5H91_09085 [Sphingomonas sp. KR1UV-12]|uniref:Uncharacterized protein n=1 Tax=Sphingomonas aurea TaxID=3063994 RepID=A0ABT9EKB1_9SPHN|nr:hypothetical protein [Sphingomonas sp. KR1UV-12]MDP1027366.1 hypothetical protein [Sphingomonas sp. KR1UV-12]
MASPISKSDPAAGWQGRFMSHDDFTARLAARRALMGEPAMPRNAGNRRTESKCALLRALDDLGAK